MNFNVFSIDATSPVFHLLNYEYLNAFFLLGFVDFADFEVFVYFNLTNLSEKNDGVEEEEIYIILVKICLICYDSIRAMMVPWKYKLPL